MSRNAAPTPAQQAIWAVVGSIPCGQVMSYGQVADRAGLGRAARMVSMALRNAPKELNLPWHRVINSRGKISFPKDAVEYGKQYELLVAEGVVFINARISVQNYFVEANTDAELWSDFFENEA